MEAPSDVSAAEGRRGVGPLEADASLGRWLLAVGGHGLARYSAEWAVGDGHQLSADVSVCQPRWYRGSALPSLRRKGAFLFEEREIYAYF